MFGVTFEVFGSSPIYVIAGVCVVLLMLYIWRTLKLRPMRVIICAVLLAGSVVAFWFFFDDMFGYIGEHAHAEDTYLETVMTRRRRHLRADDLGRRDCGFPAHQGRYAEKTHEIRHRLHHHGCGGERPLS